MKFITALEQDIARTTRDLFSAALKTVFAAVLLVHLGHLDQHQATEVGALLGAADFFTAPRRLLTAQVAKEKVDAKITPIEQIRVD